MFLILCSVCTPISAPVKTRLARSDTRSKNEPDASYPHIDYLMADLFAPDVDIKKDLTDIQFPDCSFDAIICNHVLEHIIDDRKAMSELYLVLKAGGWAILQVACS